MTISRGHKDNVEVGRGYFLTCRHVKYIHTYCEGPQYDAVAELITSEAEGRASFR